MGGLESRVRILTSNHQKPVFAPQDIVGCSKLSQGCEGGFPFLIAGRWVRERFVEECRGKYELGWITPQFAKLQCHDRWCYVNVRKGCYEFTEQWIWDWLKFLQSQRRIEIITCDEKKLQVFIFILRYAQDVGVVLEDCYPYEGKDDTCVRTTCTKHYTAYYRYVGG